MAIHRSSLFGSASIGVYALCTDEVAIVPRWIPFGKAERFSKWLRVELIHTTVGDSVLVGVLACANSNGILLPHFSRPEEVESIKSVFSGGVAVMETKRTAYGNMVLANSFGAVVDPSLKPGEVEQISDALGVETVPGEIAGMPYVGSLAVASNNGVLAHPLITESEREHISDVLRVAVDVGTINCGIPYVGTGLLCNGHAAVTGLLTTGPEMFIIGHAFDVVKNDV